MSLSSFLGEISYAVTAQDGETVATSLHFTSADDTTSIRLAEEILKPEFKSQIFKVKGALKDILEPYLLSTSTLYLLKKGVLQGDKQALTKTAFTQGETAARSLLSFLKNDQGTTWWVPIVTPILAQLRYGAYAADLVHEGEDSMTYTARLPDTLREFLAVINTDRRAWEQSKKQAFLTVINQNLKVFFAMNSVRLCSGLIKQVQTNFQDLSCFPPAQRATYEYYLGRLHVNDEKFEDAHTHLMAALNTLPCPGRGSAALAAIAARNRRRILLLLVPVRLLLGRSVSERVLASEGFECYAALTRAVVDGDVALFNDTITRWEGQLLSSGVLLLAEQLKLLVYRSLFARVHRDYICKEKDPKQHHLLQIDVLLAAMRVSNEPEVTADEVECIAAQLIFRKLLKGYIARGKCIVLSKQDPFPRPQ